MKPIILNLNEMSDSRELYDSRPNRAMPVFVYTCLALFAVAIAWMCFGKMDVTVKANGMLRPAEAVSTVVNQTGGEVLSIHVEDGSPVEEGALLYVIAHEELLAQKEFYEEKAAFCKDCLAEAVTEQSKASYKESLRELEFQLEGIERAVEACYVKAPGAGTVHMLQEPVAGTALAAGAEVCTILPAENVEYKCVIYVENKDVGELKPGMPVKLNVYSYPNVEYGYLNGTLHKIAEDITVDAQSGMAYYRAEAIVDADSFTDTSGKPLSLKAGMACQVKLITGEKRIVNFVLENMS